MKKLSPVSWDDFVKRLRELGFEGPFRGGKHPKMRKEKLTLIIPNKHEGDLGIGFLTRLLRQAGISKEEWLGKNAQSGFSIVATVMIMMILALFAAVAVSLVTTGAGIGLQEEQGDAAFYIAEGGLEKASYYIINQKDSACTADETCACDGLTGADFTNVSLGAGTFTVTSPDSDQKYITTATLNTGIDAIQTTIPVSSDPQGVYATSGRIMIDREVIEYTFLTATTFEGCKRGVAGTTAASHASGTRVGQKQCVITSTGAISTNPLVSSIQRKVSTVAELQEGWAVGGVALPTDNLRSVHCTDANNCWAVGDNGTIARWNGTVWNDVTASLSPTTENLNSVYCVSGTDCWAVGDPGGVAAQRPLTLRWNGASWTAQDNSALNERQRLRSVYCTATDNCWAVGDPGNAANERPFILWWNGTSWARKNDGVTNERQRLRSVYCTATDNCWAVGDPDNAANERPLILFWDGTSWARRNSILNINETLNSVFMVSTDNGWAVGNTGTIIRWDGTSWSLWQQANATALRWNSASWSDRSGLLPIGINELNSVSMLSYADGWAVGRRINGNSTVVRWNGTNWSSVQPSPAVNRNLNSVFAISANDGWAVGGAGTIIRWNGISWSTVASPTGNVLNSIFMLDTDNNSIADDGWAVGQSGTIIRWNGTSWNNVASPTGQNLNSVFMVSANDGWAVGRRTGGTTNGWVFLRWNGVSWSLVSVDTSPTVAQNLNSVFMLSYREGYAMGNNGAMFQWDGSAWSRLTAITGADLNEVYIIGTTSPKGQWREVFK